MNIKYSEYVDLVKCQYVAKTALSFEKFKRSWLKFFNSEKEDLTDPDKSELEFISFYSIAKVADLNDDMAYIYSEERIAGSSILVSYAKSIAYEKDRKLGALYADQFATNYCTAVKAGYPCSIAKVFADFRTFENQDEKYSFCIADFLKLYSVSESNIKSAIQYADLFEEHYKNCPVDKFCNLYALSYLRVIKRSSHQWASAYSLFLSRGASQKDSTTFANLYDFVCSKSKIGSSNELSKDIVQGYLTFKSRINKDILYPLYHNTITIAEVMPIIKSINSDFNAFSRSIKKG